MNPYLASKALDSLNELIQDNPFAERITNARMHLAAVAGEHYQIDLPPTLRHKFNDLMDCDPNDLIGTSAGISTLIFEIFRHCGVNKIGTPVDT